MKSGILVWTLRLISAMPFFSLSSVKSALYRSLGAQIGVHVKFGAGTFIYVSDFTKLKIGDGVEFGRDVKISCDGTEIGDDTRISQGVVAIGPSNLSVGRSCYLAPNVYIDLNRAVIIEDDVGIGADYIFTHSVWHPITEGGPRKFAPVHLKKGAWIPAGVFIMPGVTVGERATVGARSLIVEDVPDGCLAVGVPARVIRTAQENARKVSFEEKDELVRGIIGEYLGLIAKSKEASEKRYSEGELEIAEVECRDKGFLHRMNRWVLVYDAKVSDDSILGRLAELCTRFPTVLFVSLDFIPEDVLKKLTTSEFENLIWFNIEGKARSRSWNRDAVALHDYFRSNYGIRFKFH